MAVCKSCGAELVEGAAFCMKCGSKVEVEAVCPNCGEKLMEGAAFCMKCGTKVGEVAAVDSQTEEEPETEEIEETEVADDTTEETETIDFASEEPEETEIYVTGEDVDERGLIQQNGKTAFPDDELTSSFDLENSSYSIEEKTLTFNCDKIINNEEYNTASLSLSFWFCEESCGDELVDDDWNVNGTRVASFEFNPLTKGGYVENVKRSFTIPDSIKSGKYYVVVIISEYASDGCYYYCTWDDFDHKLVTYKK